MSESHAVTPHNTTGEWESLLPRVLELIDQNPDRCTGPELFEMLSAEGLVTEDRRPRFMAAMTYWRRTGRVGPETVSKRTIPASRVQWSDHLPFLLDVIDSSDHMPTTSELFDSLVKAGRAEPHHRRAFVNAAVRMRSRGDLPSLTAGPSGPQIEREDSGRPWDFDPSRALGETGEVMAAHLERCADHLGELLRRHGTIVFTPAMLGKLGRAGFGVSLVGEAIAELTHQGVAYVGGRDGRVILGRVVSTHLPDSVQVQPPVCVSG